MTSYESKDILKQAIMKTYNQYDEEFNMIPEEMKDDRIEDVSRTPAENLVLSSWLDNPAASMGATRN